MISTKKRRTFCAVLIILNLLFIWGNSMLPRELSAAFSKLVGSILDLLLPGPGNPSEGEGHGLLRKVAHFTEFCTLGVLLSWFVRMIRSKRWEFYVFPLVAGVAAAGIDETIQMFVPGRGPHIRDVGIDSLGVLLGICIITILAQRRKQAKTGGT